jgi:PmbA protein
MKIDPGFPEEVLSGALAKGADQAEVFLKSSRNISVEVKDRMVDSFKSSRSFGYSLRIIKDGRLGFSYSTDPLEIDALVARSIEAARFPERDDALELPEFSEIADVDVFDPELNVIAEAEAIEKVMLLEKAVYAEDVRIKKLRKASGSFTVSSTMIVNSRSVMAEYASTRCSAQVMAVAEQDGESQVGWDFDGSRFLSDVSFEDVGRKAARRAVALLGSKKMRACRAPVILDNAVTADFLGVFAGSFSSEAVQKGKSLLEGKLGKKVLSPGIRIIDSGVLRGATGSFPVDDEGVSSREKTLAEDGIIQNFLYNTYTAKRGGAVSTGNAVRGGFSSLPSVGVTNLFLTASPLEQTESIDRIFAMTGRGLYVLDAIGVHTANPVSGEFSVGVSGIWLENGKAVYPVREAVISGNLVDLFSKVEAVGNDMRFYGNIGAPSLLISSVDISA